jgi:hypothetical protein
VAENDDILRRLERLEKEARTPAWGRTASAGQKYFVLPRPRRVTLPDPQEDVLAGAGIDVTENKVSVDLDDTPGLEFDAVGDGGQLQVKPDTSRGIDVGVDGVYVVLGAGVYGLDFNAEGALRIVPGTATKQVKVWNHLTSQWTHVAPDGICLDMDFVLGQLVHIGPGVLVHEITDASGLDGIRLDAAHHVIGVRKKSNGLWYSS